MPRGRLAALTGAHFVVDLGDGGAPQGFAQVIFPDFALPDGQDQAKPRLVLRRAVTGDTLLYDWWDAFRPPVRGRRPARTANVAAVPRLVRVMLLAGAGGEPAMAWQFDGAVPELLQYSPLDANAPAICMESLTLRFERMDIV